MSRRLGGNPLRADLLTLATVVTAAYGASLVPDAGPDTGSSFGLDTLLGLAAYGIGSLLAVVNAFRATVQRDAWLLLAAGLTSSRWATCTGCS